MSTKPGGNGPPNRAQSPALVELGRRDEILELLYWMKGQNFADALSVADLQRFLTHPTEEIAASLEKLETLGAIERDGDRYRLTADGLPEARRRFVDDFRDMLAEGHGECNFSCELDHEHDGGSGR
jgi:DNA-binding IclR family transcriptional regulator